MPHVELRRTAANKKGIFHQMKIGAVYYLSQLRKMPRLNRSWSLHEDKDIGHVCWTVDDLLLDDGRPAFFTVHWGPRPVEDFDHDKRMQVPRSRSKLMTRTNILIDTGSTTNCVGQDALDEIMASIPDEQKVKDIELDENIILSGSIA